MTAEQLKQSYPETYSKVLQEGISHERARVKTWLQNSDYSVQELKAGILSSQTATDTKEELRQFNELVDNELNSKTNSPETEEELKKFNAQLDKNLQ